MHYRGFEVSRGFKLGTYLECNGYEFYYAGQNSGI